MGENMTKKYKQYFLNVAAIRDCNGNTYEIDGNMPPEIERILPDTDSDYELDFRGFFEKIDSLGYCTLTREEFDELNKS